LLIKGRNPDSVIRIFAAAAGLCVFAFYFELIADVLYGGSGQGFYAWLREKHDVRASGFSSEPSIYAAWAAMAWPLQMSAALDRSISRSKRAALLTLVVATLLSLILCGARTGLVILGAQLSLLLVFTRTRGGLPLGVGRILFVVVVSLVVVTVAAGALVASLDLEDSLSSIARIGSLLAGIHTALNEPLAGIGIGQFGHFYAQHVPDFALVSEEVLSWAEGSSQYRASTFNLFVRLICELGVPLGTIACCIVLLPLVRGLRRPAQERAQSPFVWILLAAVAGVAFWFTQDQFGYQPAILGLALLTSVQSQARRRPDSATSEQYLSPAAYGA
jgi:hypothetical protein